MRWSENKERENKRDIERQRKREMLRSIACALLKREIETQRC